MSSNESLSDDPLSMNTAEETMKAEGQRTFGSRTKGLGIMIQHIGNFYLSLRLLLVKLLLVYQLFSCIQGTKL